MRTSIFLAFLSLGILKVSIDSNRKESEITDVVESYVRQNGFSGTILISKDGKPLFHKSYGLAYYSSPDTLRNDYHYSIASITKLFTSIRILQLVDEGKLILNNPVIAYLKNFENKIPEQVRVHHLLMHTSGLPEEKDELYWHRYKPEELVNEVLSYESETKLGQFNYNNLDYMILGLIIEGVSGRHWAQEIEAAILKPLRMNETGFLEYGNYPPNFAYTYSDKWYGLKQDPLFYIENFYSAGSMFSTSSDILKLDQALYSNELLSKEAKDLLTKSYPENNYAGYGVWNYNYPFVKAKPSIMERRGKILGANVVLVRLMDDNYTIVILSNDDRFNPDSFGDKENLREIIIRKLYE